MDREGGKQRQRKDKTTITLRAIESSSVWSSTGNVKRMFQVPTGVNDIKAQQISWSYHYDSLASKFPAHFHFRGKSVFHSLKVLYVRCSPLSELSR